MSTPSGTVSTIADVDAHAGFQRAQLLELLALFQRRRRQRRRSAPAPRGDRRRGRCDGRAARRPGRGGAGEIERAQPPRRPAASRSASPRSGWCAPPPCGSRPPACAMSTAASSSGASAARMSSGAMVGKSPCTLTTISALPSGSRLLQRLVDAVRAGRVVGAGHDRLAAMRHAPRRRSRRVGRHGHAADLGRLRPAQHMDDHRQAGDVEQRLAGQAGRRHAGRNQHQNAVFGHRERVAGGRKTGRK